MTRTPINRRLVAGRVALVIAALVGCALGIVGAELFAAFRVRQTAWNIRGYRGRVLGRKAPGEIRVFAIGGSTTYGYTVERDETYPAQLEALFRQRLGQMPLVTVANLGHLSDSSVCYEPTYRDYRYLDADIVILYEGYNDVEGPSRRTERDCYQQGSLIFKWTGYFPVSPVFLREHYYRAHYGSIARGYEVARETQMAARVAATAGLPAIPAYENYERNVVSFVGARLDEGKGLVFASQPYIGNPAHLDQQTRIRRALAPYMTHPRFRYRDCLYLFGGKWDPAWFRELMWLNPQGNRVLAEKLYESVSELISTMAAR